MDRRPNLQSMLEDLLASFDQTWKKHVYFQPPASVQMHYPAIVYSRSNIRNDYANNQVYKQKLAYAVTVIDEDPDSEIVDKVSKLPMCRFDRHFTSDNLNHDVFTLYF